MKKLTLLLLLSFTLSSAFAGDDEDSTTKKLIKAKALSDNPDSTTSKLIKLDAQADALKDKDDSTTKKLIKLKTIDKMSD